MDSQTNNESDKSEKPETEAQSKSKQDNIIFIGDKPLINYVRSISVQLTAKQSSEVIIRSRGKFISKAVDVVEVAKRRFLEKEGIRVKDIKIASEEFEKDGRKINVSSMDIVLSK